mmetsp:Transcript_16709/g.47543  ORF Transcript_16709/g.47543 Transcript_16709/m.47543 type:complete len:213 (-) Transcript_16709:317-955(-)
MFRRHRASLFQRTATWWPCTPAMPSFLLASAHAFSASSYFFSLNALLPSSLLFMADSLCSRTLLISPAVWSNFFPIWGSWRHGEFWTSRRKDSSGVIPVARFVLFDFPSVCSGLTPLVSIAWTTSTGSLPSGGMRRLALCELATHAAATCRAVAPSSCFQVTSALRLSNSKQTLALPAAIAELSGGSCIFGSLLFMSARWSRSTFTVSTVPK